MYALRASEHRLVSRRNFTGHITAVDIFNQTGHYRESHGDKVKSYTGMHFFVCSSNVYYALGVEKLINELYNGACYKLDVFDKKSELVHYIKRNHSRDDLPVIFSEDLDFYVFKYMLSHCYTLVLPVSLSLNEYSGFLLSSSPAQALDYYSGSQSYSVLKTFSVREFEILSSICRGMTDREISVSLSITKTTISAHRKRIQTKLHIKNRQLLTLFCHNLLKDFTHEYKFD